MRKCRYCNSTFNDNLLRCPNCSAPYVPQEPQKEIVVDDSKKTYINKSYIMIVLMVISIIAVVFLVYRKVDTVNMHKESLDQGIVYFGNRDYVQAIREFSKIDTGSKLYSDAQDYLNQSIEEIQKSQIDNYRKKGDLASCLMIIQSIKEYIPRNSNIFETFSQIEEEYVNEVFQAAKNTYFESGNAASKAIVNEAIQVLPDNKKLNDIKALLNGVVIAGSRDLKNRTSQYGISYSETEMDSYKNNLTGELITFHVYALDDTTYIELTPAEKYSRFSCRVNANLPYEEHQMQMKIFLDGNLAYDTGAIDRKWRGEDISLDISGVYSVLVEVYGIWTHSRPELNDDPYMIVENPIFATHLDELDFDRIMMS